YVAPMRTAVLIVLGAAVFWVCFGLSRGGEFRFASWQTYLVMSNVLVALTIAATFKTVADFERLGKYLVIAGLYRATMCWISYFTWGRKTLGESGAFLTSHDDTIT